jgi:hypothetical protein
MKSLVGQLVPCFFYGITALSGCKVRTYRYVCKTALLRREQGSVPSRVVDKTISLFSRLFFGKVGVPIQRRKWYNVTMLLNKTQRRTPYDL